MTPAKDPGKEENSYGNILKVTSFLGGVQVFQMLVNLVRGKFVALFLGTEGMGISSLFVTAGSTVQKVSQLGINLAVTREVASSRGNSGRVAEILAVTSAMSRACALLGAIFCIVFSRWLSQITFSSPDYSWQFMLLSLMVFFSVDAAGKFSQLQGLHEVKRISKSTIVGSLVGLCVGVPLYYFFGSLGIVPSLTAMAIATWICYIRALAQATHNQAKASFNWKRHSPVVRRLLALGILLMAGDLIGTFAQYLLQIFLRKEGGLDTVGLYQAANSLTNQYSGMIFAAMTMDYFPRLSAIAKDPEMVRTVVNRQMEVVSLIIVPLIIILLVTAPIVIRLLLTSEFLTMTPLVKLIAVGVLFQAVGYPLGYIVVAKDEKRLFFWLEAVAGNLVFLAMSVGGYSLFGLEGLGYGMIAEQIMMLLVYVILSRARYQYIFSKRALREIFLGLAFALSAFGITFFAEGFLSIFTASAIAVISALYSIRRLRSLMRSKKISGSSRED